MLYSKGDDEKGKNIRYFRGMMAAPRVRDVMVLAQGRAAFLRQGVEEVEQSNLLSVLCSV